MPRKVTYYAFLHDFSSREEPAGVLRRTEDDEDGYDEDGYDEAFGLDLRWGKTGLLFMYEECNLYDKFFEITEEEANRIVDRIRAEVTGAGND